MNELESTISDLQELLKEKERLFKESIEPSKVLIEQLRDILKLERTCSHSKTEEFSWWYDNGYGRQRKEKGFRCLVCGAKQHYTTMDHWTYPEDEKSYE